MDKNIKKLLEGSPVSKLLEAPPSNSTRFMVDPGDYQSISDDYSEFMASIRKLTAGVTATSRQRAQFNQLKADALNKLKEVDRILEEMGDMED